MKAIIALIVFIFLFSPQQLYAVISFSISNPQHQNDEISVDVSLSGLTSSSCPNGSCYLQGAFTSPIGTPRYFGFTKNNLGNWYEYDGTPDLSYIQSTFFSFPFEASWSGKLTLKSNPNDPDYLGPGEYNLKVWRYTGNNNSYSGTSNTILVNLTGPTPTPSPSPISTPTSTPKPMTPKPTAASVRTATPKPSPAISPIPTKIVVGFEETPGPSEILGTSSAMPSPKESIKPQVKKPGENENIFQKVFIILGILTIITSAGIFARQKWIKQ